VGEAILVKTLAVADPGRWLPNFVTGGRFGKVAVLKALAEQPPEDLTPGAFALAANDRIRYTGNDRPELIELLPPPTPVPSPSANAASPRQAARRVVPVSPFT
jgi:hypothetical protein